MLATSRAVRRHALAAALVLAMVPGLVALAPPASAAVNTAGVPAAAVRAATAGQAPSTMGGIRVKLFRVTSKRTGDGGSRVVGTLKFRAWNRVTVKGRVNDLCPGDGLWASAWVEAYRRDGSSTYLTRSDKGGCDSDPDAFSYTFRKDYAITRIAIKACVRPVGDGGGMPIGHGDCRTNNFRNPKVARR